MGGFDRFLTAISRQPGETARLRASSGVRWKLFAFAALFAAVSAVFVPGFARWAARWAAFAPDVPVSDASTWRVLPSQIDERQCPADVTKSPECPASAMSRALWESPIFRRVEGISAAYNAPRTTRPRDYWVGAEFSPAMQRAALSAGATRFLIGWIDAPWRAWLNGHLVGLGPGWSETEPIVIPVSAPRLAKGKPLQLAIQIRNIYGRVHAPDFFNAEDGGEGFVTLESENLYRAYMGFSQRSRPFALFLAYSVIAFLFFFFWMAAVVRQEYFYMAFFALAGALHQAVEIDLIRYGFSPNVSDTLFLVTGFYVSVAVLLLGLSFARIRASIFKFVTPPALLAPLLVFVFEPGPAALVRLTDFWRATAMPACCVVTAVVCWLEAVALSRRARRRPWRTVRVRRLAFFGFGLVGMAAFYLASESHLGPAIARVLALALGFEHFLLVLFFAAIALREYGEQESLVARTPVSPYHQRPVLPDAVTGAVLTVDLKGSETLSRQGARDGDAGKLVDTCLALLWNAASRNGGVVLQTEGDSLRALFDGEHCSEPLRAALAASDDMARDLRALEGQFRSEGLLPAGYAGLCFRGGVASGTIRPIWLRIGETRQAAWTEAGTSNVLVESTRLMDAERQLEALPGASRVVVSGGETVLEGKHGATYRATVHLAGDSPAKISAAA